MVLPHIESITNMIKYNTKKSNLKLGLRNLHKLSRFIKVHKDTNNTKNQNNIIYKQIISKDRNCNYNKQDRETKSIWSELGSWLANNIIYVNIIFS